MKSIDKTIYFAEEEDIEATYVIKRDKKNRLVLRSMNQVAMPTIIQPAPNQYVISFRTTPLSPTLYSNILPQNQAGVNVSVNDLNTGYNMNMGINPSGQQGNYPYPPQGQYSSQGQHPPIGHHYQMPSYSGTVGCP